MRYLPLLLLAATACGPNEHGLAAAFSDDGTSVIYLVHNGDYADPKYSVRLATAAGDHLEESSVLIREQSRPINDVYYFKQDERMLLVSTHEIRVWKDGAEVAT